MYFRHSDKGAMGNKEIRRGDRLALDAISAFCLFVRSMPHHLTSRGNTEYHSHTAVPTSVVFLRAKVDFCPREGEKRFCPLVQSNQIPSHPSCSTLLPPLLVYRSPQQLYFPNTVHRRVARNSVSLPGHISPVSGQTIAAPYPD